MTIAVNEIVWYVDADSGSDATGDGTAANPFQTINQLDGAGGVGDPDGADDYIYVQGAATGEIELENGQHLIGTGAALVVDGFTLATASSNSSLTGSTGYTVTLAQDNEIAGIDILGVQGINGLTFGTLTLDDVGVDTTGWAVNLNTGTIAGTGFDRVESDGGVNNLVLQSVDGSLAISSLDLAGATADAFAINAGSVAVTVSNGAGAGITYTGTGAAFSVYGGHTGSVIYSDSINATNGTGLLFNNADGTFYAFNNTVALNGGNAGVDIVSGSDASFTFSNLTITNPTGTAFNVDNSSGGIVVTSGTITQNNAASAVVFNNHGGGIVNIGANITGNTSTANAMNLIGTNAGVYNFSGTLDIDTTSGTGFNATGGGTVTVTGTGSSINTTTGTGINFINTTVGAGGLLFDSVSVNGAADGIKLTNIGSGAVTVTDGNLANVSNRGVDISGGSGSVTIGADISSTATGRTVEVTTHTGGIVAFSGAIDENGIGVRLENNVGATMNFSGGLDIDTAATSGTEEGFQATGGGTLNVTGAANSVNTSAGSGIAVNIANTTIGASGVTFQSVSANGATNGILLNNTGTSGVFTVAGDGSSTQNASGGTIQNSAGNGISLTSVANVTLNNVDVTNSADNGLFGNGVNGLIINHSRFTDNANVASPDEAGIRILELTGDATHLTQFNNIRVTDSFENNVHIINTGGTLTNLAVTGSVFENDGSSGQAGSNFVFEADAGGLGGVPDMKLTVDGSTFDGNQTAGALTAFGLVADAEDGIVKVKVGTTTGNNFIENNVGVSVSISGSGSANFDIRNNTINGSQSNAINLFSNASTSAISTLSGFIIGNTIGTFNTLGSGSAIGSGIRLANEGANGATLQIDNNTIQEVATYEGVVLSDTVVAGTMNLTVTNNTVRELDFDRGLVVQSIIGGTANVTIANNTFSNVGGLSDVRLRATNSSTINVVQAAPTGAVNPAELDDANGGASLNLTESTGGTVNFSSGITPSLPTAFLMAARLPTASTEEAGTTTAVGSEHVTPLAVQDARSESSDEPLNSGTRLSISVPNEMTSTVVTDDGILTDAELALIVDAAIARWETAGATADQLAAMRAVSFDVTDLGGRFLGQSANAVITLDDNAAGFAWFVDATPDDDAEFADVDGQLTGQSGAAAVRIDLLTTVMHELGHQIGLGDKASGDALMAGTIDPGLRRLPDVDAVMLATGEAVTGLAYALSPISVGTLPAGKSVTVQFTSTVDALSNQEIPTYSNYSTISGSNFSSVQSNTETLGPLNTADLVLDSLTLGGNLFSDNNANGVLDGADSPFPLITVSLYADADNNNVPDGAAIDTDTTNGTGQYQFANLAPGNYIVGIDATVFGSGQSLEGLSPFPGATDPDDNVNQDNNGVPDGTGGVLTKAITLAYNSEPDGNPGGAGDEDGDADADTNFTLDIGLLEVNDAPTVLFAATTTIIDQSAVSTTSRVNVTSGVAAENFSLASSTQLTSFTVYLSEREQDANDNGVLDGFVGTLSWAIYEDNGGNLPGALVTSGSDSSPIMVDTGLTSFDGDVIQATIDLDGVALDAGNYWIALHEGEWQSFSDGSAIWWNGSTNDSTGILGAITTNVASPDGSYAGSISSYAFSLEAASLSATEQVALDLKGEILIDDPDSGGGDITVVVSVDYGILNFTSGTSGALVADSGTAAVTITGTLAEIQALLDTDLTSVVEFVANTDDPPASATLSVTVNDNGNTGFGGAMQAMGSIPIAITAVNDAPTVTNFPDAVVYAEDDPPVSLDAGSNADLSDNDSANFAGGSLTVLIDSPLPEDELVFAGMARGQTIATAGTLGSTVAIDGTVVGTIGSLGVGEKGYRIDLNADATPDLVEILFDAIRYTNTDTVDPIEGDRTIIWTLVDGDGTANGGSDTLVVQSTVQVLAVNDAPNFSIGADETVLEDSGAQSVAGFVTGIDAIEAGQTAGITSVSNDNNALFLVQPSVDVSGTLSYTPSANASGSALVTITVMDDGGTDNGGNDTTSLSFFINVTPVSDAPSGTDKTVVTQEDTSYTFTVADFGFSDPDDSPADDFAAVKIATLPAAGSLRLSGVAVTAGQEVSVADITAGLLRFAPAANANGAGYASFTFQVKDDGGTDFGGVDTDPVPNTMTINVASVNDLPVAPATNSVVTNEDAASAAVAIGASDVDGDVLTYSLKPGSEPSVGSVSFAGGSFVYTPFGNVNGSDSFVILIDDGKGGVIEQAVSVTIAPVPDAPFAVDDTVAAAGPGLATSIPVATLLANDFDLDGDPLSLTSVSNATGGTVSLVSGTVVFTPTPGFVGEGGFDYAISSADGSSSAHVTITGVVGGAVSPANQPPAIAPVALAVTLEDIAVQLTVSASDPDGDVLAFAASDGAHGTVTGGSGGVFVYTPAAGYVGTDSFTVSVSDGKGGTASRTVDVTVLDLPDTADWTVHAPDRHVSELGGTGLYMGTAGFQQVSVLDLPGLITFDSSAAITSLARLFIPGGTQTYGPIPGGSPSEVIGTNAAERISLAADANAVLDASFVRDNDTLVILGPSSDYAVAASVAGVIITSAAGAHIRIPAFASDGGVTLEFSDVTLQLTTTDGETFQIGSQTIGAMPGLIGSGLAPVGLSPGALVYRGGDLIELAGDAADWRIVETGGAALLTDGDTHVLVPLGASGVLLSFGDGPRTLALDPHTQSAMIGTQVLGEALTGITAPAQAIALPGTGSPSVEAMLELATGGEVTAGGTFAVTGTDGAEQVTMLHGMFTFDDSFGHGNDMLTLDAATSAFTAVRDSASAVLDSATLDAKIPGGSSGTPLTFTNGTHDLVYLTDTDTMTLGTQTITNIAAPLIV